MARRLTGWANRVVAVAVLGCVLVGPVDSPSSANASPTPPFLHGPHGGIALAVSTVAPIPAGTTPSATVTATTGPSATVPATGPSTAGAGPTRPIDTCTGGLGPGVLAPPIPSSPPVVPLPKVLPKGYALSAQSVNAAFNSTPGTQAVSFGSPDRKMLLLVTVEVVCSGSTNDGEVLVPDLPPVRVDGMTFGSRKALSVSFRRPVGTGQEQITVWQFGAKATTANGIALARTVPPSGLLNTMATPKGFDRRFLVSPFNDWRFTETFTFRPPGLPDPFGPTVVVSLDEGASRAVSAVTLFSAKETKLRSGASAFVTSSTTNTSGVKTVREQAFRVVGSRSVTVATAGLASGTAARLLDSVVLSDAAAFREAFGSTVVTPTTVPKPQGTVPSGGAGTTIANVTTPVGPVPVSTAETRPPGANPNISVTPNVSVTSSPAGGTDALGPVALTGSTSGTTWEVRVRTVGEIPDDRDRQLLCAVVFEKGSKAVATGSGPNCSIVPGYPTRRPPVGFDNVSANIGALTYLVVFVPPNVSRLVAIHEDGRETRHDVVPAPGTKPNASKIGVVVVEDVVTGLRSLADNGTVLGVLRGRVVPGLPGGWTLI